MVAAQGPLQHLGRCRVITRRQPHGPQLAEGAGLAEPVTDVLVAAEGLLQHLGRCRVVTGQILHNPQVAEGVGLAQPVTKVAVDAQGLLQSLGCGRVITRQPPHMPEVVKGVGLAEAVAERTCGLHRGCVPGDGLGPGAVAPQQPGQTGGERGNPSMLAGRGSLVQAGEQAGTLRPGPG